MEKYILPSLSLSSFFKQAWVTYSTKSAISDYKHAEKVDERKRQ